ncbi:MAG: hypothetical protein R2798_03580 [Chitinophagales bacterium]
MYKYFIAIASVFVWIGFVGAISFMEAWLKFQAPGITLSLGLGIGRLVFAALNKVEWVLLLLIIGNILIADSSVFTWKNLLLLVPILILIVQTFYLLPALDARAAIHIAGQSPPASNLHFYYVAIELIKVISLFVFGISFFKNT